MKNVLALSLSLVALVSCRSELGHGPLDGRVYSVELAGPAGKTADQLVFDGGRFESTLCRDHGFTGGPYDGSAGASESSFACNAKSSQSGTTAWNGKIRGEAIEGQMCWTDLKGEVQNFQFHGQAMRGALDGRTFVGMICEGDSKSGDQDTLVFKEGGFDSRACRAYGFTITPYATKSDGDATSFKAVAINAGGERNEWEGTLRGDELSGTMQHKDSSGKTSDSYRWIAHAQR